MMINSRYFMFPKKRQLTLSLPGYFSLITIGFFSVQLIFAAGVGVRRPQHPPGKPSAKTVRTSGIPDRGIPSIYRAEFRGNTRTQGRVLIQGSAQWTCYSKKCESQSIKFGVPACQKIASSQGFVTSFSYLQGYTRNSIRQIKHLSSEQLRQCNSSNQHAAPVVVHVGQPAPDRVRTSNLVLLGISNENIPAPDNIKTSPLILFGTTTNTSDIAPDRKKTKPLILIGKK